MRSTSHQVRAGAGARSSWYALALGATVGLVAAIPPILLSINSRVATWSGAVLCLALAFVLSSPAAQRRLTRTQRDSGLPPARRDFFLGLTAVLALEAVGFFLVWTAFLLSALNQ